MVWHNDIGTLEVCFTEQDPPIELDGIIEALLQRFPGARTTTHDWYEDRRRTALRIIAEHEQAGSPMPYADRILEDLDSASRRAGPRKGLEIPMEEGGVLTGDITQRRLTLTTDGTLKASETAKCIVELLYSLNIVAGIEMS